MLRTRGSREVLELNDIYSKELPTLQEPGINGEVFIESMNDDELRVTISAEASFLDISDLTKKEFIRKAIVEEYEIIFSNTPDADQIKIEDERQYIDLEPAIVQAFGLLEPFVLLAPGEEKLYEDMTDEEEEQWIIWQKLIIPDSPWKETRWWL